MERKSLMKQMVRNQLGRQINRLIGVMKIDGKGLDEMASVLTELKYVGESVWSVDDVEDYMGALKEVFDEDAEFAKETEEDIEMAFKVKGLISVGEDGNLSVNSEVYEKLRDDKDFKSLIAERHKEIRDSDEWDKFIGRMRKK